MTKCIDISKVNPEQLDRCTRWIHENTGEIFYTVLSETDNLTQYKVRYIDHHFTCECKSGQNGFANCKKSPYCKHVTWSVAHASLYRQEQTEQSKLTNLVNQGVSREVAECITYANEHPFQYTEAQIKHDQARCQRQAFSILR